MNIANMIWGNLFLVLAADGFELTQMNNVVI